VCPTPPVGVPLYDGDRHAWELEPEGSGQQQGDNADRALRMRLVNRDAKNIPRNHIRYVCWTAYLLKRHPKLNKLGLSSANAGSSDYAARVHFDQKVYEKHFVQDDLDEGVLMDAKVPIKEVRFAVASTGR